MRTTYITFMAEVYFLGFILSAYGVSTDLPKIEAITSLPELTAVHDVHSFMGLATFYQRLEKFEWTKVANKVFEEVKHLMTEALVLRLPDFNKVFKVACDASDIGIGGVLNQDGHPLEYFSEKLNDTRHLHDQKKHKKRKDNDVADTLSQRALILNMMRTRVLGFEHLTEDYADCPDFRKIASVIHDGPKTKYQDYYLLDGYLFHKKRLCLPLTGLHFSVNKTIQSLEYQFYWPSLKRDPRVAAMCLRAHPRWPLQSLNYYPDATVDLVAIPPRRSHLRDPSLVPLFHTLMGSKFAEY
ncbi:uncharacterized protein LOC144703437 [Wolffia australiana]